jgi:acyl-CoA synthetase (AMP-forming)/AMP-acid ligase II
MASMQSVLGSTIGDVLIARAERAPRSAYLVSPELGRSFRMDEVWHAVEALALELRARGFGRGDRVGIVLPNGPNLATALLAVMSAGAVAVPVNPRLTSDETEQLFAGAGVGLLLTVADRALPRKAATPTTAAAWLDGGEPLFIVTPGGRRAAAPSRPASTDDPALILHTSGSTGRPKGVVLTHKNLLANARQVVLAHDLGESDVALCVLPLFHINGLVVTGLAPLVSGGVVVMPRRFEAEAFWGWVQANRATWFSAVPTILSRLLSQPSPPPEALAGLRFARSASAALPVAVMEEFEARFGVPVIESFGISEAAGQVTSNPLPPARRKPGSVGIAYGNEVRILDDAGRAVEPGVSGEVAVRGENVFAGYLDRPDADREALRDGWLHTGDLGHLDVEGYLFLTGRRKEIINRAGEKISPREVEDVLHRRAEIEIACVVGVPDQLYGEEVMAFVSLRPGREVAADALRAHCREYLAPFKVPRRIFFVDDFPRGPNGKLQRRGLLDVYRRITFDERKAP